MTLGHAVVALLTLDLGGDISRWYRLMEEQKCQNTSNDRYRRNSLLIIRRGTTIKDALILSHSSLNLLMSKHILVMMRIQFFKTSPKHVWRPTNYYSFEHKNKISKDDKVVLFR